MGLIYSSAMLWYRIEMRPRPTLMPVDTSESENKLTIILRSPLRLVCLAGTTPAETPPREAGQQAGIAFQHQLYQQLNGITHLRLPVSKRRCRPGNRQW